jgi:hypothetical protein
MRKLSNTTNAEARDDGWVIWSNELITDYKGDPFVWECVVKAHSSKDEMMKTTKRMRVQGGWLYQVTTEGPAGYAEALTFVPST